ncbi:hypothetical protein F5050DRAFT_1811809 [Lentinula boryana]|uniref:Uncharacterized protein n=1 Tax=Lentinula boryana TaxID=40481 RepID=A0ABQ8Q0A5_9AGAR|nr:hypothetical protein F5050DRAFT_1811809 [Lentinula boryana]
MSTPPPPDIFSAPQSSPMSSIRAFIQRHGEIRNRDAFEDSSSNDSDNLLGTLNVSENAVPFVIDPALAPVNPHNILLDRVRAIKRQRVLSSDALRDFEGFENAQSPMEHMAHIFLVQLENRDMLRLLTLTQEYRVPETLKNTCQDYAWVYLLSPSIMLYKGKNGPTNVLAAMRQLNVLNLPPATETGRCDIVCEIIKKTMTDVRHHIKDKIKQSLKDDSPSHDIAALTRACIGGSKAKPTAALFMRIAFLSCAYPTCVTDKFWDKVDQSLTKTRTDCKTPAELQAVFEAILAQDKAKFGEPDLITHPAVALRDVDQWLLSVNGVAGAAADLTSVSTATSRSF